MNPAPLPTEVATSRLARGLGWFVVAVLLTMCALAAGCASGVVMPEEEALACRNQGCSAWTETEVRALIGRVFNDAFRLGWIDATKKASTGI